MRKSKFSETQIVGILRVVCCGSRERRTSSLRYRRAGEMPW